MAFTSTDWFYFVDQDVIDEERGRYPRPGYGAGSPDSTLANDGHYRLWEDTGGDAPGPYYRKVTGELIVANERVERVDYWDDSTPEQKRQRITDNIGAQVSEPSAKDLIDDPDIEKDVIREESAAEDKRIELQNTQDAALDDFDPTIAVAPKQDGVEYSRLIADLLMQEPWVGTPDNVYGPVVSLTVQSGYEDQGSEARMNVVAPGAVNIPSLTFVQRAAPDDNVWDLVYPSDRLWASPDDSCTVELLWGVGSVPVSRKIKLNGYGHRVGQPVRYGVAGAGGQGRRRR